MITTDLSVSKNVYLHTRATGKEAKKIANATVLAIVAFVLVIVGVAGYYLLPKKQDETLLISQ